MSEQAKIFCVGNRLGIIIENRFEPLKGFKKFEFMICIIRVIGTQKFKSETEVLKKAMIDYIGITKIAKNYNKQGITQSEFYMKWVKRIRKNKKFKKYAEPINKKIAQNQEKKRKAKEELRVYEESARYRYEGVAKKRRRILLSR